MRETIKCRLTAAAAAGVAAVAGFAASAHAADPVKDYPLRPVRIVSGYTAGGSTDFLFRVLAPKLTDRLGQPFIIDYRQGGSGTIGANLVAKATPESLRTQLQTEIAKWAPIIRKAGIYAD